MGVKLSLSSEISLTASDKKQLIKVVTMPDVPVWVFAVLTFLLDIANRTFWIAS